MKYLTISFVCLLQVLICANLAQAQIPATINIQGVLRSTNGTAVPDGPYTVIFKFYEELEGGTAKWTETQDVEVTSGIYNAILGSVSPFSDAVPPITFDRQYFLEVVVSGKALQPRIPLTPAPYALSLLGDPNTFPSSGAIRADGSVFGEDLDQNWLDLSPEHSVVVKGGVLARGATGAAGAPGADGANNNGYAFENDKDSGLFSTGDNKVALYTNNTERLLVSNDSVKVQGHVEVGGNISTTGNLNMSNTEGIRYGALDDWRLVYWDDFKNNDPNGWQWYDPTGGEIVGWSNGSPGGSASIQGTTSSFAGNFIIPGSSNFDNRRVLKKGYNMANVGPYDFIKIKFKYYVIDTWNGLVDGDRAWAGIAESASGTQLRVGWTLRELTYTGYTGGLNTAAFNTATNFTGGSNSDYTRNVEMTFFKCTSCSSTVWVMFGGALSDGPVDENWGVGMIEIWVK